jgi:hypothetical protein
MTLTPAAYDRAELLAEQGLPNRLIQACRPALFDHIGYPARAASSGGLWRWADAMHEGRFETDFSEKLGGGLTTEEWDYWRQIMRAVRNLTNGTPVVPRGALARATISYRAVRARLSPPALIVDIGPGSGYLTALLGLAGYRVLTVENAQAFYLWQSRLFAMLFDARFGEWLAGDANPDCYILHAPWWKFYRLDTREIDALPVKAACAAHVLCEMHRDAVAYFARLCGDNWCAPLFIDEYGKDILGAQGDVQRALQRWSVDFCSVDPCADRPTLRPISLDVVLDFRDELMGGPSSGSLDELWWLMLHGPGHHG